MKLDDTDLEQSFFPPTEKLVDNSVGYVVIGLFVVLFFSLMFVGIQRVQNASRPSSGGQSQSAFELAPEIGGGESDRN